jgi:hypothetical protein
MMNEQQMAKFFNTPMGRKMMRDTQKWFDETKAELNKQMGQKEMIQSEITKQMMGNPEQRNIDIVKNINGTLFKVATDDFANVKDVTPIRSFEELSYQERTSLMQTDKKLYLRLQHGLYEPNLTEKHLDLMVLENVKLEEFNLLADEPLKPFLDGLALEDSQRVLTEYRIANEDYEKRFEIFKADKEAYQSGKMQEDLRNVEEQIQTLEADLK